MAERAGDAGQPEGKPATAGARRGHLPALAVPHRGVTTLIRQTLPQNEARVTAILSTDQQVTKSTQS